MARQPRKTAGLGGEGLADTSEFDTYIGADREVVVDPSRGIIALHDGVTPGGKRFAPLGSDSKIPDAFLPSLVITDTFEVADETAMLALTAQRGDIAIRSDINKTFILSNAPATTLANWKELKTPTDVVQSVAGKTGVITLAISDIPTLQTVLDAKVPLTQKGIANGVATLGPDGMVPSAQLPANGRYKGNWDASTNTPAVVAGTGNNGDEYTVSVAGTQSVTGSSIAFGVGDRLKFTSNGNKWERIPNTQLVASVNGKTGVVGLTQDDVGDGTTNKVFTNTEKIKLAGIATSATANQTDTYLRSRANHTGVQVISTIDGLTAALYDWNQ